LKDKTPKEVFAGIKPEVGNLRIFGCPVYIHVLVFLGYSENSKAYMIYVLGQREIEVRRYVTFHVEATFKKSIEIQ
jgi:hypothetical protein